MFESEFKSLVKTFRNYSQSHYSKNRELQYNIKVKEEHTFRVVSLMKQLTKSLDLPERSRNLALVAALLHDIGRFPQLTKYGTFSDKSSENHAELSIKTVDELKMLKNFSDSEILTIKDAIRNHNRYKIEDGLPEESILQAKLIRDADKLDIFYINLKYQEERTSKPNSIMEIELPDTPGYSSVIVKELLACRNIDYNLRKNYNDMKLGHLSWLFGLNFAYSFEVIEQKGYIEKIISHLPDNQEIRELSQHMQNYLNKARSEKVAG